MSIQPQAPGMGLDTQLVNFRPSPYMPINSASGEIRLIELLPGDYDVPW